MTQILLVEDENSLAHGIQLNLEMEGYSVVHLSGGKEVVDTIKKGFFDLLILDIMLPEVNGFEIAESVRSFNKIPIMFISAKNNSTDRVKGLKIGADDYLAKPFDLEELLLRVHLLIARNIPESSSFQDTIEINGNLVNFKSFVAQTQHGEKSLSKKEIEVLKVLIEKEGEAVPREEILQKVWADDAEASSRTIDNFIVNFRKYFETNPKEPEYFQSVRGVGYLFKMLP